MKKSQYEELKKNVKSIEKEIEMRMRGLRILSRKVIHLLRPVEIEKHSASLSNTLQSKAFV